MSRILAIPVILLLALFGYLAWHDSSYSPYLIPLVVLLVILYTMGPQIDWWWYERNPPDVDPPVKKMLASTNPFYKRLSDADKQKFRQRLEMFVLATNYMPKGWEKIPEDAKYAIAVNAVQLNFNKKDFLYPAYENIVVYPTPFPSPQHKDFHPSEVFKEDGVLLFSAEQIMWGLLNARNYYNVAMHEYVKVFMDTYPTPAYPTFTEEDWLDLSKVGPYNKEHIHNLLNVPDIDPTVVAITLFQLFPEKFQQVFPKRGKQLVAIFQ